MIMRFKIKNYVINETKLFIKQVNEIKKYYCIKFIERNIELLKILIKDHKPRNS